MRFIAAQTLPPRPIPKVYRQVGYQAISSYMYGSRILEPMSVGTQLVTEANIFPREDVGMMLEYR